jgi:hypothetical protein
MNIFAEGPKNQNRTVCMSAKGFPSILLPFVDKTKNTVLLLTSFESLTNSENSSSRSLQKLVPAFR